MPGGKSPKSSECFPYLFIRQTFNYPTNEPELQTTPTKADKDRAQLKRTAGDEDEKCKSRKTLMKDVNEGASAGTQTISEDEQQPVEQTLTLKRLVSLNFESRI